MTIDLRPRLHAPLLRGIALTLLLAALPASLATRGHAMCDVIPSPTDFFRGALGSITTPALIPGLSVDVIVRSVVCSQDERSAAPDFLAASGATLSAADLSVAIVFQPLDPTAPRNGVWLRPSCPGSGSDSIPVPGAETGTVHCLSGAAAEYEVVSVDLGDGTMQDRLRFIFPDTDALVDAPDDGLGLAGPAKVAVLLAGEDFPAALATTTCADYTGDLVSCADFLYKRDSTCNTTAGDVEPAAIHMTALPAPNDFAAICEKPDALDEESPCLRIPGDPPPQVLFSTDIEGNLLVPMDYTDVLVRVLGEPFPQLVAGALEAGGIPVEVPSEAFLESRAPNWALLPPLFAPAADPEAIGELFGSVDARIGIHRVLRRSPNFMQCDGGAQPGLQYFEASDCPAGSCEPGTCTENASLECTGDLVCAGAGECGPENFDLSGEAAGEGCSSIIGACPDDFPCTTKGVVRLEVVSSGSTEDRAIAVPVNECVDEIAGGADSINRGDDQVDEALLLYDRTTFDVQKIGQGARGRAVTRIRLGPFSFDSSMVEEGVVVYLESEFQEGCTDSPDFCDRNENDLVSDDFLRVHRLAAPGSEFADDLMDVAELTSLVVPPTLDTVSGYASPDGLLLAVEAEPRIDSKPVVISEGRVFARVDPLDNEERELEITSRASDSGGPGYEADDVSEARVSHGGDLVIFTTTDDLLDGGDDNGEDDVYLRDRTPSAITRRVSIPDCYQQDEEEEFEGDARSFSGDVSADGRWAVFASIAENLVDGDNDKTDIFLRDMWGDCGLYPDPQEVLYLLSRDTGGGLANGDSYQPRISADGSLVVWYSFASDLVASDTGNPDIFLLDRDSNGDGVLGDHAPIEKISDTSGGFAAFGPDTSETGVVAYLQSEGESTSDLLSAENGSIEILNPIFTGASNPSISADGRYVAFELSLFATESSSVVVYDRETGETRTALSSTSPPECSESTPESFDADLSADGRYLAVSTEASFSEDDEDSGEKDLYREDLLTGAVSLLGELGYVETDPKPSISSRGNMLSFLGDVIECECVCECEGEPECGCEEEGECDEYECESMSASYLHGPESSAETGAFLTVMDARLVPPEIYVLDLPADYVAVSNGRAVVAAEGENVQLFRYACEEDFSISCSEDVECAGDGPCVPIVEDLLRPAVARPGAVAIDESYACAIVEQAGEEVVACHEIGTPPTSSLDDVIDAAGEPVPADSIQVFGGKLAVKVPVGDGNFVFYSADLTTDGPLVPHEFVEDLVLGEVACFTVPEPVLGGVCDLDADGDCNNDVMNVVVDLGDPDALVLNCERLSIPCDRGACSPARPHSVIGRTCKFLIDEELVGLDGVGTPELGGDPNELEVLIGRCTPNDDGTSVISEIGNPVDLDSNEGENPVEEGEGGDTDVTLRGLCIDDVSSNASTPCVDNTDCGLSQTCSTQLEIVTLVNPDRDGDGIFDVDDNCPDVKNPGQENFDAVAEAPENVGDACDPFTCGDGIQQAAEECDDGPGNGGSCTTECTVSPLSCPCFEPSELTAPINQCLQLTPRFGNYTMNQSYGLGGYYAYSRTNSCRYFSYTGGSRYMNVSPQEASDCRQMLIDAAADQGVSCTVF